MKTIQEYADKHGVSYEAIRKQISRYEDELQGHIRKVERKIYIDEEAEAFLDERRRSNPVIVMETEKTEELEALREENAKLKNTILELQLQITTLQQRFIQVQDDKMELIRDAARTDLLIEMKDKQEHALEEAKSKIAELEAEAKRYRRTVFGLYKKIYDDDDEE